MKVTVFCEQNELMATEAGKRAYPEGMGECLRALMEEAGSDASLVLQDKDGDGRDLLPLLGETDVLLWWGHIYHENVSDEVVSAVRDRVQRGMGLIVLHSGHMSKPLRALLGTSCTLKWREAGELERLWCVCPGHPIAAGLGEYVDIPQEEMYGEFFDIPVPDELVYVGWFRGGEVFRGGCVFHRGRGKVFYFNPGHETYPTYRIPEVRRLLAQAADYLAPKEICPPLVCPHVEEFSVK